MYEPAETELSYDYLLKLSDTLGELGSGKFAIVGGWATFFLVNERFKEATGREYLKSRDIDVSIDPDPDFVAKFEKTIKTLGFEKGAYPFRYVLIWDRVNGRIVSEEESKEMLTFNLVYIYLDVFSAVEVNIGTWVMPELAEMPTKAITPLVYVPTADFMLDLKADAYSGREKLHKKLKDACDLYALLSYSSENVKISPKVSSVIGKILAGDDCTHIAETLFNDRYADGLVRRNLKSLIK